MITTALGEVIKKIINRLCDRVNDDHAAPAIQITINANTYVLPPDKTIVLEKIDYLTKR